MLMIKNEKGVTLTMLVLTIVVLLVISIPVTVRTIEVEQVKKYSNLKDDLTNLAEAVSIVYDSQKDISEIGPLYEAVGTELSSCI